MDLCISSAVILAGIGLFFLHKGLGVTVIIGGILMLFIYKAAFVRTGEEKTLLTKKAFDLSKSCRQSVFDYLSGKDVTPKIVSPNGGGIVRLEVYFNKKEEVVYAQLFDFTDYTYSEATGLVELRSPASGKLLSQI